MNYEHPRIIPVGSAAEVIHSHQCRKPQFTKDAGGCGDTRDSSGAYEADE